MSQNTPAQGRGRALTKTHKLSLAGVAGLGAAALAISLVPGGGQTTTADSATAPVVYDEQHIKDVKASVTDQLAGASLKAEAAAAKQKAAAETDAKKSDAEKKATEERGTESTSRSAERAPVQPVAEKTYANNLDGWIRESLDIMKKNDIPGSYYWLHKNIMRESSGNPKAINNWDINAINGIPSKGLLQVIPPTFEAYHVSGTPKDIYDPVANIVAAANYAADRYGSIDNVDGPY
ncbi:transglycosylase SLT domain-containing protein [Streptomyces sp. CRN 30]|uniref:transglycosylase SLT domain-containing protein n=1 Tax=Streptomyces sp. CRN 30 TaxID=3075613 RepID=UPI002A81C366|nr:transglycosylase SLT domain-containing protein [Streptomyces sp. CRN 30]